MLPKVIEPNHRILVIDDNHAIHEDLRKILTVEGGAADDLQSDEEFLFDAAPVPVTSFHIDSAFQGQEGVEKIRQALIEGRPYALVFVDVRMPPGWDGVETIMRYREIDPNLETVLCTAYSDYSWNDLQRKLGHSDNLLILKKPFDNIEVIQLAHALTRKWLVSRQAEARMADLDLMVEKRTAELQAAHERIQREFEEKSRAQEAFRVIFQESPVTITLMDQDGRYLDVNSAFEEMYGVRKEQVLGRTELEAGILAPQIVTEVQEEVLARGSVDGKEVVYRCPGGCPCTGLLWVRSVSISRVTHYLGFLLNITERKRMEVELQRARIAAEAAAKAKSEFLANMSHEIRTPLNGVLGLSALLEAEEMPATIHAMIRLIRESGEMLGRVLNDVLDFSKIDSGRLELEEVAFSLKDCLEWSVGLYQKAAMEKALHLKLDYDGEIPAQIVGDPTRVQQIVANLISNAVKFTAEGSVAVGAELEERDAERGTCQVRIWVQDTGMGIPENRLDRLFQSFSQVDPSTSRRYGGTGLGLAISKRLVEAMGGEISVASQPGIGSRFEFRLEARVRGPGCADEGAGPSGPPAGMRVLVAEDNRVNQIVIQQMLERLDCLSTLVADGGAAVEEAARQNYDLILMDVQMPGIDGLEATRQIRALPHPRSLVPVIAITASATTEDRDACLAGGMDDYISKPVNLDALKLLLERWHTNGVSDAAKLGLVQGVNNGC